MLNVGRMLYDARIAKGTSLEQAERDTRIRAKYLRALENNNFDKLPGRSYVAGFIKNYSDYLGLNSNHTLAIFRRQFDDTQATQVLPRGMTESFGSSSFHLTPRLAAIIGSGILLVLFFSYLFFEYRYVALAPTLTVDNPVNEQRVQVGSIVVQGKSDPDATITINAQPVSLQVDGQFSTEVSLKPGINTITIESKNKFGKNATVMRVVEFTAP